MSSLPWMPLYIRDYLADTAHLTIAESGAYLHLIMHYWLNRGLPDDNRALAHIAKMTRNQWRYARPRLQQFFHDGWHHRRIDKELANAEHGPRTGGNTPSYFTQMNEKYANEINDPLLHTSDTHTPPSKEDGGVRARGRARPPREKSVKEKQQEAMRDALDQLNDFIARGDANGSGDAGAPPARRLSGRQRP